MLDHVEKAYFFEIERKTKLQTALAFPISIIIVGMALIGNSLENSGYDPTPWVILPLLPASAAFLFFVVNIWKFLIGRTYKYIWTADRALAHFKSLEAFSRAHPDAPKAEETFREQITIDLAGCAEKNALLNDARSTNLYYANVAAFIFILASLASSGILVAEKIANEIFMSDRDKAPPPPPPPPPPVRDVKDGANSPRPKTN